MSSKQPTTGDPFEPGTVFKYDGPRRLWIFKTSGIAQILGVDDQEGDTVHVRLLQPSADERLETFIGHVPISRGCLVESDMSLVGHMPIQHPWAKSYERWRQRRALDLVAPFAVPLSQIVCLVLDTMVENLDSRHALERHKIDWAFATRESADDGFATVEVGGHGADLASHAESSPGKKLVDEELAEPE